MSLSGGLTPFAHPLPLDAYAMNAMSFDSSYNAARRVPSQVTTRRLGQIVVGLASAGVLGYVLLASTAGHATPKFVTRPTAPAPLSPIESGRVVQADSAVLRSGDPNLQAMPNAERGVVGVSLRPMVAVNTLPTLAPQAGDMGMGTAPQVAAPSVSSAPVGIDVARSMQPQLTRSQMEEGKRQADAAAAILAASTPEG